MAVYTTHQSHDTKISIPSAYAKVTALLPIVNALFEGPSVSVSSRMQVQGTQNTIKFYPSHALLSFIILTNDSRHHRKQFQVAKRDQDYAAGCHGDLMAVRTGQEPCLDPGNASASRRASSPQPSQTRHGTRLKPISLRGPKQTDTPTCHLVCPVSHPSALWRIGQFLARHETKQPRRSPSRPETPNTSTLRLSTRLSRSPPARSGSNGLNGHERDPGGCLPLA